MKDRIKKFMGNLRPWHWMMGTGSLIVIASIVVDPLAGIMAALGCVCALVGFFERAEGERDPFQG